MKFIFAALPALVICAFAHAGDLSTSTASELKSIFTTKTGLPVDSIQSAPMTGLVEVVSGQGVFYMDTTGRWLFDGNVVDLSNKQSITAVKRLALMKPQSTPAPVEAPGNINVVPNAVDWSKLGQSDAIKTTYGTYDKSRVVALFEDPNCGFCKRMTTELKTLKNVTVLTYQISILGPDSQAKNDIIWCAKDKVANWDAAMTGKPLQNRGESCDTTPLGRNAEMAQRLGVKGTPTLFFQDGSKIVGYVNASVIEAQLAGSTKRR
jgi:thiol:disulfide interchange protein DsbC